MACFACMPDCDKCIPKFITCPDCSQRGMLKDAACAQCGHFFTPQEKRQARDRWIAQLMSS